MVIFIHWKRGHSCSLQLFYSERIGIVSRPFLVLSSSNFRRGVLSVADRCYLIYGESIKGEAPAGNFLAVASGDSRILAHCVSLFGEPTWGEGSQQKPGTETYVWAHDELDLAFTHFRLLAGLTSLRTYLITRSKRLGLESQEKVAHMIR